MIRSFTRGEDFNRVLSLLIGDRFLKSKTNFFSFTRLDIKRKLKEHGYEDISDLTPCNELIELLLIYQTVPEEYLTESFYSDLKRFNEFLPNIITDNKKHPIVKYAYNSTQRLFPKKYKSHSLRLNKLKTFCDENGFIYVEKLRGVSLGYLYRKVVSLTRINYIHGCLYFTVIFYEKSINDNYQEFFSDEVLKEKVVSAADKISESGRISVRPISLEELKIILLKIKEWYESFRMDTASRIAS